MNLREVVCHYTTLNQEVTLEASDLLGEFHLDISDDTATSSSDDEVMRYFAKIIKLEFIIFVVYYIGTFTVISQPHDLVSFDLYDT